jgi:hypothetical protein
MCATDVNEAYPLMEGKKPAKSTSIYVCKNYTCGLPVSSIEEVMPKVLTK